MTFGATRPNFARIYDYLLGGKDHFQAEREAAEALKVARPDIADLLLENKKFLTRAVTFVARDGIRQFLDIGSGLPTSPVRPTGGPLWLATHEVTPGAAVMYVDYDPVAVLHSEALLAVGTGPVAILTGDMRDPEAILAYEQMREAGIRLVAPACVILGAVLHFLDFDTAKMVASSFAGALLIIDHEQQRLPGRRFREQAQHGEADQEPVGNRPRITAQAEPAP